MKNKRLDEFYNKLKLLEQEYAIKVSANYKETYGDGYDRFSSISFTDCWIEFEDLFTGKCIAHIDEDKNLIYDKGN